MAKKNKGWCWLVHHRELLEYCYDFKGRRKFIREEKPVNEIKTRLKWLRFVKGRLPKAVTTAETAYCRAKVAWDRADRVCPGTKESLATFRRADIACDKAVVACEKALKDNKAAIEALHKKECSGCPWDGTTLVF